MLVLSKIEYGSLIYSSARKSVLKLLNPLHHRGIRSALGALSTSPLESLYVESGIPSLEIIRQKHLLVYAIRVLSMPNHPNYEIFSNPIDRYRQTATKPAPIRTQIVCEENNFTIPKNILNTEYHINPPWTTPTPKIHTELTKYVKHTTPPALYRSLFQEIIKKGQYDKVIYTDGSKTDDGVAAAIFSLIHCDQWSLPNYTSIFTAEQFAVWKALEYCQHLGKREKLLIVSDSLSTLKAITQFSEDPLTNKILNIFTDLSTTGNIVEMAWAPSHIGILGNDRADELAKEATKGPMSYEISKKSDFKNHIYKTFRQKWNQYWLQTNNHLKVFKKSPGVTILPDSLTREEKVKIHRIRIGHTRFTHEYIFKKEQPPMCENCQECNTVNHILFSCRKFTMQREKYQIQKIPSINNDDYAI